MGGSGCTSSPQDPEVWLNSVTITVDPDANDNSATAVDLLIVYKKELLDAVLKMTAKDYFKSATQIRRDYPEMVDIFRWEVIPGQLLGPQPLTTKDSSPVGAVVFASYNLPGEHRIRLGSEGDIRIHLTNNTFFIEPTVLAEEG